MSLLGFGLAISALLLLILAMMSTEAGHAWTVGRFIVRIGAAASVLFAVLWASPWGRRPEMAGLTTLVTGLAGLLCLAVVPTLDIYASGLAFVAIIVAIDYVLLTFSVLNGWSWLAHPGSGLPRHSTPTHGRVTDSVMTDEQPKRSNPPHPPHPARPAKTGYVRVEHPALWWLCMALGLSGIALHHSPINHNVGTALLVVNDLFLAGLTIDTGLKRPARWMSWIQASFLLMGAVRWSLLQGRPTLTTGLLDVASLIAWFAWFHLVLRKRLPRTTGASRSRLTRLVAATVGFPLLVYVGAGFVLFLFIIILPYPASDDTTHWETIFGASLASLIILGGSFGAAVRWYEQRFPETSAAPGWKRKRGHRG